MEKEIQELICKLETGDKNGNNFFDLTCQEIQKKADTIAGGSDTVSNCISGSFDIGFMAGFLSGRGRPYKKAIKAELKELLEDLDGHIEYDRELMNEGVLNHE